MTILNPYDIIAVSFWLATAAMMATTVFLFVERQSLSINWRLPITIAGLITLVSFFHYLYMREIWVATLSIPIVFRYVDWFITVPLQYVEFYFILAAVSRVSCGFFWKLLIASIVMLTAGYVGEAGLFNPLWSFIIGMASWLYFLFMIWFGEGVKAQRDVTNPSASTAYIMIRYIVTFGWAIYPIGYALAILSTTIDPNGLNIVYNLADLINKVGFVLIIWYAAYTDSAIFNLHSN